MIGGVYMDNVNMNGLVSQEAVERMWSNLQDIHDKLATPPKSREYTLQSSNWTGTSAPYMYKLTVDGVTSDNVVIVSIANSLSDSDFLTQCELNRNADILRVKQSIDTLTFYAFGDKPSSNIIYDIAVL